MWLEVTLERISIEVAEALSNRMFELGATGVEDTELETDGKLKAYFNTPNWQALESEIGTFLKRVSPEGAFSIVETGQKTWSEDWKKFHRPSYFGARFYLVPAWEEVIDLPEKRILIKLEPGQAFGTGLHESTQLSVCGLERVLPNPREASKLSLLDVGTGSGILSIAAEKLGVGRVVAIDNDSIALKAARENIKLNGCERIALSSRPIEKISKKFDIVVSNILLETHQSFHDDYLRILNPSGVLILSGLLRGQETDLEHNAFVKAGRKMVGEAMNDWIAITYHCPK